jgi:nitrile hydratase accessory protein
MMYDSLPLDIQNRRAAFQKPWHATGFAILLSLHRAGLFSWPEWVDAFSSRDRMSPDRAGECVEDGYYRRVLETVEDLLSGKGMMTAQALAAMDDAWRRAYLGTPHGMPVELSNAVAVKDDHNHHDHSERHHRHPTSARIPARERAIPVAISPATPTL